MNLYDPSMSLDELVKLNSILGSPVKDPYTINNGKNGTKRKANQDWDGWEGVTVLEVKRMKKNESGKKKAPDSSPDSSPVYFRSLSTSATIHRVSSDIITDDEQAANSDLEDEDKLAAVTSLKSDSSTDLDAPLPPESGGLSPIKKKKTFRPTVIDFDEIVVDESAFSYSPVSPKLASSAPTTIGPPPPIEVEALAEATKHQIND